MIAHPPCTHLTVSGARWFKDKKQEQETALAFVRCLDGLFCLQEPKERVARVHHEPPGPDRWKNRSRTYKGIAQVMAAQRC